jgi:hypothetical protein
MIEALIDLGPGWTPEDTDKDGEITGADIPFPPGSIEAKKAWMQIENLAHSPANVAKCKTLGYEDGRGMYAGRPLVPGAGPGQGDFQFLVDKLIWYNGEAPEVATKIAAKARWNNA